MKSKKYAKKLTLNKKTIASFIESKDMNKKMQKIKGGTGWATCNTCSDPPYYFTCFTNCMQVTCDYSCGQFDTCNGGPC